MPTGHYERPPIVADRLRWLEPHVDGFRPWLETRGYRAVTIVEVVRLLSVWAGWTRDAGFDLTTIEAATTASAAVFQGGRTARAPQGAAKLFIAWLRAEGVLPPEVHTSSPEEVWPLLAAYSGWMREQRGLAESTLVLRRTILADLLATMGDDPAMYTAGALRGFVLERAAPHGRGRAQGIAVAVRSYLRYLIAAGQCRPGLDHAIPGFANWKLAATPRFLTEPDLARVIQACNADDRLRDRAVVLLLARLGLRASEEADLRLSQIDWVQGTLTVRGKTRRDECLPLPQDVGDALLTYLRHARPRVTSARVFLTEIAPVVPMSRVAIKCLVRRALDRPERTVSEHPRLSFWTPPTRPRRPSHAVPSTGRWRPASRP